MAGTLESTTSFLCLAYHIFVFKVNAEVDDDDTETNDDRAEHNEIGAKTDNYYAETIDFGAKEN